MAPPQDFKSLQDGVQKSLVSAVKSVNRISAEDLSFQRTVNPDAAEHLDEKSARLLDISTRLLQSAARACGVKAPRLEDAEDVDVNWQGVVDVVDSVLEKADTALDEYTGLIKRRDPPNGESGPKSKKAKPTGKVIRNANVIKPQTLFEKTPDNFPTGPWKPILTEKPHATVPLKASLVTFTDEDGTTQYKHPYEPEITQMSYPERVYKVAEPIPWQPVETTAATWVDTFDGVLKMLEELKKAKEIAVDLEHHDFRTYTGLVSLMQVSTREQDWIVDTLQPWRHKLEVLNQVFADPSIIKVFHGAYMDMVWLQRDLGLYVNGLFDTYFACEQLNYSGRSLAFLLSRLADFDADKQYQLADWRIRPIPEEMLYYARSDTHYLLHIFDRVRNDLVSSSKRNDPEQDLIGRALQKSKDLSLSRHVHAGYNEESGDGPRGWYNYILKHSHLSYNAEQFSVFKAIWKWRDEVARQEDESPNFVLGTNNVADIARVNPPDAKALHSLLPMTAPLARARLTAIWERVQEAKTNPGRSLLQFFANIAPDSATRNALPQPSRALAKLPELGGDITFHRLPRSRLFGDMPISSLWDSSREVDDSLDEEIPFPWRRFVASVQEGTELDPDSAAAQEQISPIAAEPAAKAADTSADIDEEFTLKQGRKRKSASLDEEESETSEESESDAHEGMDDVDTSGVIEIDEPSSKKAKKHRKVQQKKMRMEQQEREDDERRLAQLAKKQKRKDDKQKQKQPATQQKKYEAVPFDYSTASSVMHANRNTAPAPTQKPKKVFDPYSKTGENEIKGARKAPPIRGERSATFKK